MTEEQEYCRTCVVCSNEFTTRKSQQIYCSHDCYAEAAKSRGNDYYKKLKAAKQPIPKICPNCHEHFETTRLRVKYCSQQCYHEASLEKNRAYSQALRDEYKAQHPKKFERECDLCGEKYDYRTKQGKYCVKCKSLGAQLAKGQGPVNLPSNLEKAAAGQNGGEMPGNNKCFICGGKAEKADEPCANCK